MGGRPRKTQEELDKEMEDYWGSKADGAVVANGQAKAGVADAPPAAVVEDEDIDMIT